MIYMQYMTQSLTYLLYVKIMACQKNYLATDCNYNVIEKLAMGNVISAKHLTAFYIFDFCDRVASSSWIPDLSWFLSFCSDLTKIALI